MWQSRLTKLELFICIFVELGVAVWQSRLTKLELFTFYLYICRTGCSCVAIKTSTTCTLVNNEVKQKHSLSLVRTFCIMIKKSTRYPECGWQKSVDTDTLVNSLNAEFQ